MTHSCIELDKAVVHVIRLVSFLLLCPWDFLGKNTGVDCHFLLQRIFQTQESNPGLLHCRQILYQMSYEGRKCKWHAKQHYMQSRHFMGEEF